MAINKNALIRYKALDKCFSNAYKRFYIEDLIEYCSQILSDYYLTPTTVSRRQVFDDIAFMESEAGYNAPIVKCKDGRRVYYAYNDANFSIEKHWLSNDEEAQIKSALTLLNRVKALPGFDWVATLQTKLAAGFNFEQEPSPVIHFEENEFLNGLHHVHTLYQYIVNKQVIQLRYQSFKASSPTLYTLSPWYLKQFNNRWFIFGWNHHLAMIQTFAVDRLIDITFTNAIYQHTTTDFNAYFDDIIGVSNFANESVTDIIIELSDNILPYIKTKPIHGTQKIKGNVLTLQLKLNYELETLILSHGENMKVIAPTVLKERLKERITQLYQLYQ